MLPILALPETDALVNVPTEVMLGCAAVVTVPAVVAELTVPVTLAPGIEVKLAPEPTNSPAPILPTFALPLALNVPAMFAPLAVTTNTLALPADEIVTLPSCNTTTLLVPLTIALLYDVLLPDTTNCPPNGLVSTNDVALACNVASPK